MPPSTINISFAYSEKCVTLNECSDEFNLCISDIVSERYITTKENGFRNDWFRAKNVWLHVEGEKAEELADLVFKDYISIIIVSNVLNSWSYESYFVDRDIGEITLYNHEGCRPAKANKLQVIKEAENQLDIFIGREASKQFEDYWLKREGY